MRSSRVGRDGEGDRGQGQHDAADVGQQVGAVGQQRERAGGDADRHLDARG